MTPGHRWPGVIVTAMDGGNAENAGAVFSRAERSNLLNSGTPFGRVVNGLLRGLRPPRPGSVSFVRPKETDERKGRPGRFAAHNPARCPARPRKPGRCATRRAQTTRLGSNRCSRTSPGLARVLGSLQRGCERQNFPAHFASLIAPCALMILRVGALGSDERAFLLQNR